MKNLIGEKLKEKLLKNKIKYIFILSLLFIFNNLYCYEIIRDPIFENYFDNLSQELDLNKVDVLLVKNNKPNAFVLNESIYFTTGLLKKINNEDTLKAIYLHEYGHLIKNHLQSKKIKIQKTNKRSNFLSLFSIGLAIISGNSDIGIGASISLNSNLINEISIHSINFEIEADNFMIEQIKKNKINIDELVSFLNSLPNTKNNYFKTHPNNIDRINNLKKINFAQSINSNKFSWIKSKYSNNSKNNSFNNFFKNLEKGIYNQNKKIAKIDNYIVQYEVYKKGIYLKNWQNNFENFLMSNDNSYLKIEYINYLLDNNFVHRYSFIEKQKYREDIMNEYYYYYIYGKYYDKIKYINLSNFYFCQFFKLIKSVNKSDFFCKKYDIKDIPILDKSYALFK